MHVTKLIFLSLIASGVPDGCTTVLPNVFVEVSKYVPWIQRNLKNFTDAHIILNPWRNQAILGLHWIRNYFNMLDHHNLYLIHRIFYFWLHYGEKREKIGNETTRRQKTATRTKLSIQTILDLMNRQIMEFLHLMKCLLLNISYENLPNSEISLLPRNFH